MARPEAPKVCPTLAADLLRAIVFAHGEHAGAGAGATFSLAVETRPGPPRASRLTVYNDGAGAYRLVLEGVRE